MQAFVELDLQLDDTGTISARQGVVVARNMGRLVQDAMVKLHGSGTERTVHGKPPENG
jgi:hypothetical protein